MIYVVVTIAAFAGVVLGSLGTAVYLLVREDKYDALRRKLTGR